ncbi:hypothetical protein BH09BAC3_BH09BAC3_12300 [soil metagenome]
MNIKSLLTAFLLITFFSSGFCQKIKYKELIVLLNNKQFSDAEPYLKKYLKENIDNGSAYIYMAQIYQEKAGKMDLLKQTHEKVSFLDSVVYFANKAKPLITEKELSWNEENYQQYSRRDFRTGKYDITLSDVVLSLDNMIKLKERGTMYLTLKAQFGAAQNAYTRAQRFFSATQKPFASSKEFFLRADEKLIGDLKYLAQIYDSCQMHFNDYRQTTELLGGKTGYNQDINPQEIVDFKTDGHSTPDFYHDDLKLWDYKRWALSNVEAFEKDIFPLQNRLIEADVEINNLQQKLKKDSVSLRIEIAALRKKLQFPELKKVDPHPLPLLIFDMKLAELDYSSKVCDDHSIKDSLRISLHMSALKMEIMLAKKLDTLSSSLLSNGILETESLNYKNFIAKAFGITAVLESQIKASQEIARKEIAKKEHELNTRSESLRWIVNAADSIPLFLDVQAKSRFKPIVIVEDKFTTGIEFGKDSTSSGYFYTITPSRKIDLHAVYPIDKKMFIKRNLPYTKAIGVHDETGKVYFVMLYLEARINEKFPATLIKIYRQEGLAWSVNYSFDQLPAEMSFSSETFEISVKTKSSVGEVYVVSFDKSGKVIK